MLVAYEKDRGSEKTTAQKIQRVVRIEEANKVDFTERSKKHHNI